MNHEEKLEKRTIKDSVFTDLFSDKKYLLQLYRSLHPEDLEATEDDLTTITLKNVLTNQIYNNLGFAKGDRLIILLECQSKWTGNIILRILLYIAETYQRYFKERECDLYDTKRIPIPKPEFYMLYVGDRKDRSKHMRLSEEFFNGETASLEMTVNILYGENENDILGQYIAFTRIYAEQKRIYGPKDIRKAILETIRICKDRNLLVEYLKSKEKEVVSIMITLFDEEEIQRTFIARERREAADEERQNGIRSLITAYKKLNGTISDAIESVITDYQISEQEARTLVEKYW